MTVHYTKGEKIDGDSRPARTASPWHATLFDVIQSRQFTVSPPLHHKEQITALKYSYHLAFYLYGVFHTPSGFLDQNLVFLFSRIFVAASFSHFRSNETFEETRLLKKRDFWGDEIFGGITHDFWRNNSRYSEEQQLSEKWVSKK